MAMSDYDADDVRNRVRARFGVRSADYRASVAHSSGGDLDLLIELVAPTVGARALDIATGAGHTALALASAGADVTASDLTPEMLAEAADNLEANGLTATMAIADALDLPFANESFDIVTARMAPHHFPDPKRFIDEVARVLAPGGRFGLEDQAGPEDVAGGSVINEYEIVRDPSHNRQLPVSEWRALAQSAGLLVEHAEVFDKWVEFDWWTSIQNVSQDGRETLSALLAAGPETAREWYSPAFRANGLIERFRIPHLIMLTGKPK